MADPSISPTSGTVVPVSASISCPTPSAVIRYTLNGASNVRCFTIEERLPAPVTPINIDNGGQWLPALGVVRWGPYTNVPAVTVSYRITGLPGSYSVSGLGAW